MPPTLALRDHGSTTDTTRRGCLAWRDDALFASPFFCPTRCDVLAPTFSLGSNSSSSAGGGGAIGSQAESGSENITACWAEERRGKQGVIAPSQTSTPGGVGGAAMITQRQRRRHSWQLRPSQAPSVPCDKKQEAWTDGKKVSVPDPSMINEIMFRIRNHSSDCHMNTLRVK